jgi:epoxyqueuosine reductase QueG
MEDLTSEIKALAKCEGISLIGVAPARGWKVAKGHRPRDLLPDARSVIVMAMQVSDKVIDEGSTEDREMDGKALGQKMDQIGSMVMSVLIINGYIGVPVEFVHFRLGAIPAPYRTPEYFRALAKHPSNREYLRGTIPLKYAAYKAGLGAIGRSSLLITPEYGPRVRLSAIVTNAPLTPSLPSNTDFCLSCRVCEKVCVAKAFREGRHDPDICWIGEWELGDQMPGLPYKVCPAPCLKLCPVGKLKEKYRPPRQPSL